MVVTVFLPFPETCLVVGLKGRVVTSIAACKYFSGLVTADGQV
jgi:hypothetical protein